MKSAFEIERAAKILSPVDTGRLRASIATSLGVMNRGITSIVSTNVFYAIYVHEGTKRMRKRPFMRQAAESSIGKITSYYQNAEVRAMQAIANLSK
jgi:HK97 gp10 family phage protein